MRIRKKTVHEPTPITFDDVKEWYDKNIHPEIIDAADERVYKYVYDAGRWAGIFQFTEAGAQKFVQKVKPRNIIDIAVATSIFRPGPLSAHVDKIYIKAKKNPSGVVYEHPLVEQVLKTMHGTIIFQESMMALGHVVGGFTLDECDKLRKVISKRTLSTKDAAVGETEKLGKKFVEGAVANGLDEAAATALFEKMKFFSGYGFNMSLASGTQVTVADGTRLAHKKIEDVVVGDHVVTRDEASGQERVTPVVALHDHGELQLFEFTMNDGATVTCTMAHKFRTTMGEMLPICEIMSRGLEIASKNETC